jgi:hypothetical protein
MQGGLDAAMHRACLRRHCRDGGKGCGNFSTRYVEPMCPGDPSVINDVAWLGRRGHAPVGF